MLRLIPDTNIFIGGVEDTKNYNTLDFRDIKVTLCVIDDREGATHPGISYLKIGLADPQDDLAPNNPIPEAVEILGIASRLALRRAGNVLVFCADGDNRAALVAAIWLTWERNITLKEAVKITEVKENKPWMKAFGLNWEDEEVTEENKEKE